MKEHLGPMDLYLYFGLEDKAFICSLIWLDIMIMNENQLVYPYCGVCIIIQNTGCLARELLIDR